MKDYFILPFLQGPGEPGVFTQVDDITVHSGDIPSCADCTVFGKVWQEVGGWVTHPHWPGKKKNKTVYSFWSLWHVVSPAFLLEAELGELLLCPSRAPAEQQ